jgi:hypothetical protein
MLASDKSPLARKAMLFAQAYFEGVASISVYLIRGTWAALLGSVIALAHGDWLFASVLLK